MSYNQDVKSGKIGWRSPSNIALVKYWGKYSRQLPSNPSISFTLSNSYTETWMTYEPKEKDGNVIVNFRFEGKKKVAFSSRIKKYFESILDEMPFLSQYKFSVSSRNTFPHSSGIASSASAMSALALCICQLDQELNAHSNQQEFLKKASYIARLGSGSACRSLYPNLVVWGDHKEYSQSSNEYGIPAPFQFDPVFNTMHDDILIVSGEEKKVSSSAGHALMKNHAYAKLRYDQARDHMSQIKSALIKGDLKSFGLIVENEALSIHSLMMTSSPSYMLMLPNTLAIIQRIRTFREESQFPIYFTLDAGPNVHVLYPDAIKQEAKQFIKSELLAFCHDQTVIEDHVGNGPISL